MSQGDEIEDDAPGDDDMVMCINSLTPDEDVRSKLRNFSARMNQQISKPDWKDGVRRMHEALEREGVSDPIIEVFSPTRVNGMAARLGIASGLSLDLTTNDPDDGMPWDFNSKSKREKAIDIVLSKRALLVIGSPMCKSFCRT